ncbi:MAG: glycosyltransferase family 4 protein [Isosphaeraceae bacterium]
MRVNFVLPDVNLSGGVRVIAMYAEHLRRRGHDVLVVSTPRKMLPFRARVKRLVQGHGWQSARPGPSHFDSLEVQHHVIERFRPIIDSDLPDADVVVATWWETAEWVARLAGEKGAKAYLIQQFESNFVNQPGERVEATWKLPMQKIVVSRWLADLARERFGDPDSIIVPNGIDLGLFHAPPRGKQSRPTVGMLYAPTRPHKGNATALAAIEIARQRFPDLHVRAFGVGKIVASMPLPGGSSYWQSPDQSSLREIYSGCDVWLCTSTSEGYHLPPHEAMACRCPVVSTRVGGPMDLIKDGVNGYLEDVGDHKGLAARLMEILNLPEADWMRMSESAYQTAQSFSWEDATALFEGALESAIRRFSLAPGT